MVKFNDNDRKVVNLDYITMVKEIERRKEMEIIKILKKRNIID